MLASADLTIVGATIPLEPAAFGEGWNPPAHDGHRGRLVESGTGGQGPAPRAHRHAAGRVA
jgi:hypothetical protein